MWQNRVNIGQVSPIYTWFSKIFVSKMSYCQKGDGQCLGHVISTGCQMTNLVSIFEYLSLLCFAEFRNLGNLQGYKGALTQER